MNKKKTSLKSSDKSKNKTLKENIVTSKSSKSGEQIISRTLESIDKKESRSMMSIVQTIILNDESDEVTVDIEIVSPLTEFGDSTFSEDDGKKDELSGNCFYTVKDISKKLNILTNFQLQEGITDLPKIIYTFKIKGKPMSPISRQFFQQSDTGLYLFDALFPFEIL